MPNTYSQIYLHYVFSPKYRQSLIKPEFEQELFKYISGICSNINQNLIRINGMPDHIHMLIRLRPAMPPSKCIQIIKANSSKWINENKFLDQRFSWQIGGGIFSVGPRGVDRVIRYIDKQKAHHNKGKFKDEYLDLLIQNQIEFKDEYLLKFF